MSIATRACIGCGVVLPLLSGFHRHPSGNAGRRSRCKACVNAARRAHYDPAAAKAYSMAYKASAASRATYEERKCQQCGDVFHFYTSLNSSRPGQGKFCSIRCKSKAGRVVVSCARCGAAFVTWRSVKRKFCSLRCAGRIATVKSLTRGPVLYGQPHWRKQLRASVLERDGHMCQGCFSTKQLVVHHIRPWRASRDNSLENLITVCRSCHARMHAEAGDSDYVPVSRVVGAHP